LDTDKKEAEAACFVIMWELAKIDGESIQIGNTTFHPSKTHPDPHFNLSKFQVAVSHLRTNFPFREAEKLLQAGKEMEAREILKFYHPNFRSMRDCMWARLFESLPNRELSQSLPQSPVERARAIMRKHTSKFHDLKKNDEMRSLVFIEFDNENIPVIKDRNTGRPWAKKYSDLQKGTKPYTRVMASLSRYFYPLKNSAKDQILPTDQPNQLPL
jgi:hypothetical protein